VTMQMNGLKVKSGSPIARGSILIRCAPPHGRRVTAPVAATSRAPNPAATDGA
jgi:hypothetical protein